MEMKVGKSFYMLEVKGKERTITLYDKMDEAVKKVSEYLKKGTRSDQIELTEIDVEEKELRATSVSWSTIAEKLIKQV